MVKTAGRIVLRYGRSSSHAWRLVVWPRLASRYHGPSDLSEERLAEKNVTQKVPSLIVSSPHNTLDHFETGFTAVYASLFANLRQPDTLSAYRYAVPGPAFRGIYLWDSAFIVQIWRWWDLEVAGDILRSVVAARHGDRLQHVASDIVKSPLTQPPLIAWSLANLLDHDQSDASIKLASELYPILKTYSEWLQANRQIAPGLYAWRHPYESGCDNSPRFTSRSEFRRVSTETLASPDFSTYMVLQYEALGRIAHRLGKDKDARRYRSLAGKARKALNTNLWHDADSLYYDWDVSADTWRHIRSIASLLPLWAGAPNKSQADQLRLQAVDPFGFGTLLPFPSVALSDKAFEPDMWRGAVWLNMAYGALEGLRRYGYAREAAELAWRLCDGVYRVYEDEGQLYEFYDPRVRHTDYLTRKRGNSWKRLTLGGGPQRGFVGWTGLVNNILIEMLMGLQYKDGRLTVSPTFPAAARDGTFCLILPRDNITVSATVIDSEHVTGFVQKGTRRVEYTAGFGETIDCEALLTE